MRGRRRAPGYGKTLPANPYEWRTVWGLAFWIFLIGAIVGGMSPAFVLAGVCAVAYVLIRIVWP